jgi:HlyD family secretion protein
VRPGSLLRAVPIATTSGVALILACGQVGASNDGAARPYRVGAVSTGDVRVFVEETGVVEPERQIVVKSPISGLVQYLGVHEGDHVMQGQQLVRIVPDIAQSNSLAQLGSQLTGAQLVREHAKLEYDRALGLLATRGITQSDVDQRRLTLDQAENQLKAARDQLRLVQQSGVTAGDTLQWASVTAPAAGVVIKRGVEEGETVVGGTSTYGGGTELFTIADLSALRVKAAINEVDIGKVAAGDSVSLTVDAFPDDTARGVVRLVPPAARLQDRVRVFDVVIAVRGSFRALRPGMTANVRIAGPARRGVTRLPVEAVFLSEGRPVVYRVVGGRPDRVAVMLGLGDLSYVEIKSGVVSGDSVALEDPIAAMERARSARRK